MIEFLSLYAADIIVSLIILAAIGAAGMKIYKDRKKGTCTGCSGYCSKDGCGCCGCSKNTNNS